MNFLLLVSFILSLQVGWIISGKEHAEADECNLFLSALDFFVGGHVDKSALHSRSIAILKSDINLLKHLLLYVKCVSDPPNIIALDSLCSDYDLPPFELLVLSDGVKMKQMQCPLDQRRISLNYFVFVSTGLGGEMKKELSSRYLDPLGELEVVQSILHLRAEAVIGSGRVRHDAYPQYMQDIMCDSSGRGGSSFDLVPILSVRHLVAAVYGAVCLSISGGDVPFASTLTGQKSPLETIRSLLESGDQSPGPVLYSHSVSIGALKNLFSAHTASPPRALSSDLNQKRENSLPAHESAPLFQVDPLHSSADDLWRDLSEHVQRLVQVSPSLCSLVIVRARRADREVQWMSRRVHSLLAQNFLVAIMSADLAASTLSKAAALIGGHDQTASGLCFLNQSLADSLSGRPIPVFTPQLLRGGRLQGELSMGVAVVVVGENLDESRTVKALQDAFTPLSLSGKEQENISKPLSVVGLFWSDDAITSPVDARDGKARHAYQSLVNIAVSGASTDAASVFRVVNADVPRRVPFPSQQPHRPRTILLTHMYNEEFLLPHWIAHHAPLFDMAVLVDYNSSDESLRLVRELAPPSWRVVQSRHDEFSCREADIELMEIERRYPHDWKIVLTVAEFLVVGDLRQYVAEVFRDVDESSTAPAVIRFPSFFMIDGQGQAGKEGDDSKNCSRLVSDIPLICQRSQYFIDSEQPRHWFGVTMYSRFLHRHLPDSIEYGSGRHYLRYHGDLLTDSVARELASRESLSLKWRVVDDGPFIAKYKWAPWPESVERTLQIFPKISEHDRHAGTPHRYSSRKALEDKRKSILRGSYIADFATLRLNADLFVDMRTQHHRLWAELCDAPPTLLFPGISRSLSGELVNATRCRAGVSTQQEQVRLGDDGSITSADEETCLCLEQVKSDLFHLDVSYIKGEEVVSDQVELSMSDLLLFRTSPERADSAWKSCSSFCVDVLRHEDVNECCRNILSFAHSWVFDMNMCSS